VQISGLYIYPVKSLRGTRVESARVLDRGFEGDRRFMIVRPDGEFLTQRSTPVLGRITARIDGGNLVLDHREHASVTVSTEPSGTREIDVRVWDSRVTAERVDDRVDRWLAAIVGQTVHLVVMPETTRRAVEPEYNRGDDIVSFADGFPYLLIGDASVADLNNRLAESVTMERFRPNITVSGALPFAEDTWRSVRCGDVSFDVRKACARCVVTTLDPDTGAKGKEPLATLATYRNVGGRILMGMNLVSDGSGTVKVGQSVEPVIDVPK
jgi:uncharacterized protein YcbX